VLIFISENILKLYIQPNFLNSSVCRPEHSVSLDEPRASIKVTHLNRVVVDTGRVSVELDEIKDVT